MYNALAIKRLYDFLAITFDCLPSALYPKSTHFLVLFLIPIS